MWEALAKFIVGFVTVNSTVFLAMIALSILSPKHRAVILESKKEQQRSSFFLTVYIATFLTAMFGLPNGLLIGIAPIAWFATPISSVAVAGVVAVVVALGYNFVLSRFPKNRSGGRPLFAFVRNIFQSFMINLPAVFVVHTQFF